MLNLPKGSKLFRKQKNSIEDDEENARDLCCVIMEKFHMSPKEFWELPIPTAFELGNYLKKVAEVQAKEMKKAQSKIKK